MSTQTQSTRVQGVKCSVHRCTRIKTPFPFRCLASPFQSPRSTMFILPQICSIHLHLGNGRDFLRAFICTLTSIPSFSSVTVCFALNLLLFSFTPPFILSSCSRFNGEHDSAVTLIPESENQSRFPFSFITYVLFFLLCIPLFLSFALQLTTSLLSSKRPLQISFLSDMFLFIQNQLLDSAKTKKKKPSPLSIFLLGGLGRIPG